MKAPIILLLASVFALPASADDLSDTLKAVTSKGSIVLMQGQAVHFDYAADGTFSAGDGQLTGTWKADGDQLCLTIPGMVDNACTTYPGGKTSGDTFTVTSESGPVTITIR
jgi:hypothetical protein